MKSYMQGLITGGVMVFASIVFMGNAEAFKKLMTDHKKNEVGRYIYNEVFKDDKTTRFWVDTKLGNVIMKEELPNYFTFKESSFNEYFYSIEEDKKRAKEGKDPVQWRK